MSAEGVLVDTDGDHVNRIGRCAGGGDIDGVGILDLVVTANRYVGDGVGLDNADRRDAVWLVPGRDGAGPRRPHDPGERLGGREPARLLPR